MKNKTMNLCNTCKNNFATCNSDIEFGIGLGNDNVVGCSSYKLEDRLNEGCCPNCGCETFVKLGLGRIQCCKCGQTY